MPVVPRVRVSVARASATEEVDPVQRQILCRAMNEHIREISPAFPSAAEVDLVCKCERPGCFETIHVSPLVYEDVRRFPTRFLVKSGHDEPESDRVAMESDRVVVVEKIRPEDAQAAIRADPRRERLPHPAAQPG